MTQPSRQILEQIAMLSAEGIIVVDTTSPAYPVVYANPAYETLTGFSAAETIGQPWRMLGTGGADSAELAALREALGAAEPYAGTFSDRRRDGTSWLGRIRAQPIPGRRGLVRQYLILHTAAMEPETGQTGVHMGLLQRELKRAQQRAAKLDRIDPASGLLRYEYFLELAERDFRIARRNRSLVGVAFIAINDLDVYGKTFGAKAVDSCVRMIGAQVTGSLRRAGDLCACDTDRRIVVLTLEQGAEALGDRLGRIAANVRRLGLHNPRGRAGRYVTVATGVAVCAPAGDLTLADLIEQARVRLDCNAARKGAQSSAG